MALPGAGSWLQGLRRGMRGREDGGDRRPCGRNGKEPGRKRSTRATMMASTKNGPRAGPCQRTSSPPLSSPPEEGKDTWRGGKESLCIHPGEPSMG